jgi:hypothetical protein
MRLRLLRFASNEEATLGSVHIDTRFACFSLEDQRQPEKVKSETRIPPGLYQIKLRAEGGMHEKYKTRYTDHRGMLWLQDVPDFEWIYIHTGNTDDHSAGCILVGDNALVGFELAQSVQAYRRIYGFVSNAILAGEPVEILVEDGDST